MHDSPAPTDGSASVESNERVATSLAELALAQDATVEDVAVDALAGAWLDAVGIAKGERVVVIRRALFGGPLHVRTGAGGEFALDRSLARQIRVRVHP